MKKKLEQRLQTLKAEFKSGQKMLADLEAKQANLRDTLLRISGAIQVLEELADTDNEDNGEVPQQPEPEIDTMAESEPVIMPQQP